MPVSEEKTTAYQATESERAIIGAILRGDILPRNIELTLEDFTDLICHEVFAVMQKLDAQNKTCDLVTVSDAMPNFDSTLLVDLLQSGIRCRRLTAACMSTRMIWCVSKNRFRRFFRL